MPLGKRRPSRGVVAAWRELCSHWRHPGLGAALLTRNIILMGLCLPSHGPLPAGVPLGVAPGGCGVKDCQPSSGRHPGHSPVTLLLCQSLPRSSGSSCLFFPTKGRSRFLSHVGLRLCSRGWLTDLGSSSYSILLFCLFIVFMGFSGKNTEVVCHSLLQWTTFCQTSPP